MSKTDSLPELEERVPATEDVLPDLRGYGWNTHSVTHFECGTQAVAPFKIGHEQEQTPGENGFVCITEGVNEYLDAHGVQELEIPQFYSRFAAEFDTFIDEWTIQDYGIGIGITSYDLKTAVRLANGKGHIDHDTTTVVLCDNQTFLITGPRGAFIVDQSPIRTSHLETRRDPPNDALWTIPETTISVPESSKHLRNGLIRFVDAVEEYTGVSLTDSGSPGDGKHTLITESGENIYAQKGRLELLDEMATDQSDLYRTYSHSLDGEEFTTSVDSSSFSHELRDETLRGIVIGYLPAWKRDEYIMGDGVAHLRLEIHYICMNSRPEKYSHYDIQFNRLEETVDSWDFTG